MDNPKKNILNSFKDELGRLFLISFGVFLFILFFQPFPLQMLDYNNRLLFVTGIGVAVFLIEFLTFILIPLLIPKWFKMSEWESGPPFLLSSIFLILTTIALVFYVRYVGMVQLSLYIMFKVILVCLFPLMVLVILYKNKSLERIISVLKEQNKFYFSKIKEFEKRGIEEEIDFISDNKSDKLSLKFKNIISIKSADNYIEINYLNEGTVDKKLLRSTLKNIESQLTGQKNFIRCHRTTIVNSLFIDKLTANYNGSYLKMSYLEEKISVSRQYVVMVKDVVSAIQ
ncbi:MAG: LytTR family transcriptional regulator DNA-binding domain-containing protein [Bacteroidales bacterium]|nr:LytTR family transcriptional regulator DNA-binding domain-containing protein [Bacteroidales bacterium]